ncbi:MAG TPA: 4'-phosphopantetheinyl transferase superfamily protein [Ktedonobacteraceae bacterium]|nr:4'-phosphopantetheinyl transferase superfamily protein [Ktedonobacteraceae bacterium]
MNNDEIWPIPSTFPLLAENEVHVWRMKLEKLTDKISFFRRFLTDSEQEKAGRFYFEKDRQLWTAAHGLLRILLGQYLNADPLSIRFVTNDYGKPSLAQPAAEQNLHFNLSHSGGMALLAFTYGREVGVDVEQRRSDVEYENLSAHYFSSYECDVLRSLPLEVQEEAFFACWSRKEAYIKARGKGLSIVLDQFDVSLAPGEPARLLASREAPEAPDRWSLREILPGPGYAGALVTEGFDWQVRCWQWNNAILQEKSSISENG